MIEIKNLHKSFNRQAVLKGVNLVIPEGKITVVIGKSGEGKSVLLKHLIGLLSPDSGQVVVNGVDIAGLSSKGLTEFRKSFGMLFQNAALFDSLSVFDNVAFPLVEHTTLSASAIRKRVREVLSLVGLNDADEKMPSELSGGMRKRAGLARAIALTPRILLYDEPTTGLDPIMTDAINGLIIKTQRELKVTSVVISHDIESSFQIGDKVALLHEGRILLEGTEVDFKKSTHPFVKSFFAADSSYRNHS